MQAHSFENIVKDLTGMATPRVWSLLVTVFGELAQDEGASISGLTLSKLNEAMGVKPDAMRVALHRLRKDGWIISTRHGRESDHALTEWGRGECKGANPRIYGKRPVNMAAWVVVYDRASVPLDMPRDTVWLTGNSCISPIHDVTGTGFSASVQNQSDVPTWMREKVCSPDLVTQARALHARLMRVTISVDALAPMSCFERAVLRVLIVHSWRRIILKVPDLPMAVFPDGWKGHQCREQVVRLLDTLPKVTLKQLHAVA